MDSFEARLQFIQVIKNLQKSLNVSKEDTDGTLGIGLGSGQSSGANSVSHSGSYSNIQELDDTTIGTQVSKSMSDPLQFYLKHYAHHYEDFHQCLFDTGLKMDPLHRLNIVIFYYQIILALVAEMKKRKIDTSSLQATVVYEHLIPSMPRIFEICLPKDDWKALSNLKSCTDIYYNLLRLLKTLPGYQLEMSPEEMTLSEYTMDSEEVIQAMTQPTSELAWKTIANDDKPQNVSQSILWTRELLNDRMIKKYVVFKTFVTNGVCNLKNSHNSSTSNNNVSNILHRMENDRERHKRQKENNWVVERVSQSMLDENEFKAAWNSITSLPSLSRSDQKDIRQLHTIARGSYLI